jgi:hypothetical protein
LLISRLSLFDFRQVRYTFAKKPGVILRCARKMLGLSMVDVVRAAKRAGLKMSLARYRTIESDTEGHGIGAIEWWGLCKLLGLDCDIFSLGYSARWHMMKVRMSVHNGELRVPLRPNLASRVAAFEEWDQSRHETIFGRPGLRFALRPRLVASETHSSL